MLPTNIQKGQKVLVAATVLDIHDGKIKLQVASKGGILTAIIGGCNNIGSFTGVDRGPALSEMTRPGSSFSGTAPVTSGLPPDIAAARAVKYGPADPNTPVDPNNPNDPRNPQFLASTGVRPFDPNDPRNNPGFVQQNPVDPRYPVDPRNPNDPRYERDPNYPGLARDPNAPGSGPGYEGLDVLDLQETTPALVE